ncbi:21 kDa protein [Malania oleifera]|uniref:21 kDa protein n=1 Tax=Malania oleifera TaxID=397392 RepID=UPI0025AEBF3A|nr:21 kDa protein [Malania oleifera]
MQKNQLLFFLCFLCLFFFSLQPIPALGDSPPETDGPDFIRASCGATLYPDLCYASLSGYADVIEQSPAQLAKVAVTISLSKARHVASYISNISRDGDCCSEPRAVAALHDCASTFGDAVDEIRGSLKQMRQAGAATAGESFRFMMFNVQTWMSAALTNQDTCTDGFEDVSDETLKTNVCDQAVTAKKFTSNALALVNSYVDSVGTP